MSLIDKTGDSNSCLLFVFINWRIHYWRVIKLKKCEVCEIEIDSDRKDVKYCSECRVSVRKEKVKKYQEKRSKKNILKTREKLDEAFASLNPSGVNLIPHTFDKVSSISSRSYLRHFNCTWSEILEIYNKKKDFIDFITIEYNKWNIETGFHSFVRFSSENGFRWNTFDSADIETITKDAIIDFKKYTVNDLRNEFLRVIDKLHEGFSYTDFEEESRISMKMYTDAFNIKVDTIPSLMKIFELDKSFIENYIIKRKKLRSENSPKPQPTYSISDLINNFKSTVDNQIQIYGEVPTINQFLESSSISLSTYKYRLDKTYHELLREMGYESNNAGSSNERIVLEIFSRLLKEDYVTQATFKWLKSVRGTPLRCDGYFPLNNIVVEYDGKQHYHPIDLFGGEKTFRLTQQNDKTKNDTLRKNGVNIIRIAYDEPFLNEDFIKMRIYENGIVPPKHTVVYDSHCPSQLKQAN